MDTQVAVLHRVSDKKEIIIPVISGAAVLCWKAENRFELDFERLIGRGALRMREDDISEAVE